MPHPEPELHPAADPPLLRSFVKQEYQDPSPRCSTPTLLARLESEALDGRGCWSQI